MDCNFKIHCNLIYIYVPAFCININFYFIIYLFGNFFIWLIDFSLIVNGFIMLCVILNLLLIYDEIILKVISVYDFVILLVIYLFSYRFFCTLFHNLLQQFSRSFILFASGEFCFDVCDILEHSFIVSKTFLLINICIWRYNVFLYRLKRNSICLMIAP